MLLLAIAITIVCFLLYSSLERDASGNFRGFTALDISLSIGAGIVTSAVCFFVDMIQRGNGIPMLLQYLPVVLLIIMIGMMVGLMAKIYAGDYCCYLGRILAGRLWMARN